MLSDDVFLYVKHVKTKVKFKVLSILKRSVFNI